MSQEEVSSPPATSVQIETSVRTPAPKENSRPKTTINLGNILKPVAKAEPTPVEKNGTTQKQDDPIVESKVRLAWKEYTELKKNQLAEYHLLSQEFTLKGNVITLQLTNPIEEPMLLALKSELVAYLRERVNNSTLQVEGELQQLHVKKRAYTNKEKFEYLVEKNPAIRELKDRLGLDPDY